MKRVRVAPGKVVVVSTAIVEKAARVFSSGAFMTRDQVHAAGGFEPRSVGAAMLGASAVTPMPVSRKGSATRVANQQVGDGPNES